MDFYLNRSSRCSRSSPAGCTIGPPCVVAKRSANDTSCDGAYGEPKSVSHRHQVAYFWIYRWTRLELVLTLIVFCSQATIGNSANPSNYKFVLDPVKYPLFFRGSLVSPATIFQSDLLFFPPQFQFHVGLISSRLSPSCRLVPRFPCDCLVMDPRQSLQLRSDGTDQFLQLISNPFQSAVC